MFWVADSFNLQIFKNGPIINVDRTRFDKIVIQNKILRIFL